ncbi:hypothetical protein [Bifidobacterium adolescentis]|uniref:hypothetical protein n=1 Tax=Bifidobacterium adolescentis TaxID=1680 RepID=UPI003BB5F251
MVRRSELLPDERILPLSLVVKAMIGVESLRTRPSGMVSFDNADGTKTIIGGSGTDQIATNAGDTQAPSRPTGLSATSTMQVALVHWDGTLEYGMVDDFDHIEIFAQPDGGDVLDIGYMRTAGELATGRLPVGSVVELWAVAADNAHDLQGNPSPNMSDESDHLVVTIDEPVDQNQIRETAEKLQKAADGAAAKADEAIKQGEQIRQDAQAGIDDARKQAQDAAAKADKARSDLQAEMDANKQAADNAIANVDKKADKAQSDLEAQTAALKSSIANVDAKAEQVKADASKISQRVDADKAALDKSIASVDAKAQAASDKGDQLAGQISDVTTTVNGHTTKLGELSTRIEGVASDGQTTVKSLTSLQQTVTGLSSTVSQNTKTASDAMSKVSQVEQTANGISANLSKNYTTTADADEKYAAKTELKATADGLQANITRSQQTADGAVTAANKAQATADGFGATLSKDYQTAKASDEKYSTKAELKATSDGLSSSLSSVKQTADGAVTAASKAQQTADVVSLNLSKNYATKSQADATYATQTSLKATSDSLTASINSTAKTAQSSVDKATNLEANLNGFKTTVSQTYTTKTEFANLSIGGTNRIVLSGGVAGRIGTSGDSGSIDTGTHWTSAYVSVAQAAYVLSSDIKVEGNTYVSVAFYDMDKKFISRPTGAMTNLAAPWSRILTVPTNAAYMRASFPTNQKGHIKLEKGTKPTDWSPAPEDLQPAGDYATNSSLTQTANSITAQVTEVSKTATSAMNKSTTVEQTANGLSTRITAQGKTLDATTKTANEAKSTADSNKQTISQVKTTADGAVSRVSSLEQNLDGFESTVAKTYQPKDGMSAYATTSALKQTSDSITAQVAEVSKTASGAMSKAITVEQTANGLSTRITEQAKTLDATVKTANEAKSTADSNKTTISQTSNLVNAALAGDNLITDGGFESTAWWMGLKAPFRLSVGSFYHGAHVLVCDAATGDNRCPLTHAKGMAGTATAITVTKGRTYRLSGYCVWYGSVPSNVNPGVEKLRLAKPDGTYIADAQCGKSTSWAETHVDWKCPDDGSITSVRIEVMHQTNGTIMWDDVSFRDITEAAATSTRVASVEQNLNGFKTSVADTYQPKSGMGGYATQSQLTQTANQIRGEVSEKYQSKDGMGSYATNSALTQKANEITGKVQEVAKTTQGNTTTISQVSQKADKINTTLSQKIDGKADVSRVSSLEQNLSGFKTTVAQSYQPKGDYPTRSDMQSSISQTASSIKSEVANTYTTQAATETLRKSATRTFTLGGAAGKAKWVKLGYLTSNGDNSSVLIHVYSGDGYNGQASQNAEFEIFVKDGYQSTTSATGAFGVSVSRIRAADDVKVKVMAFSSTTCNIWAYMPWAYWNGHYTLQGDYKSWQDGPNCGGTKIEDAEPTSGTAQDLAYDTLSTRSYVDQTAKSVALGVVQSYKGSDGSGLATKSDITATKNSITSSVSSTYATKTGVTQEISSKITQNNNSLDVKFSTKTETKNAQDTANTANSHASDAQSRIGSLEDCINMTSQGVRVGKRVNGKWSGWSALVNTGGSYDIFDGAGAKQATFSSGRLDLGKSSYNTNGIYVPAGGNWTSGWLCIDDYLVDCDHTRHIYACARGGLLCFKGRVALTNPNAGGDQRVIDGGKWYRAMQGKYSVYPYLDVDDDERDWPVTFKRSDNNLLAVGTLFIPRTTRDIWWYDPTRGKHTMWIDLNNLQIPMGNNVIG